MKIIIYSLSLVVVVSFAALSPNQAQDPSKTVHDTSGMNQDEMNKRGDKVMGFEHAKTTHHFILAPEGGAIEVSANMAADKSSRAKIRSHLSHIAMMFAEGDFNAPFLIHQQNPPGVEVMQRLKNEIQYKFEKSERGGRVRISTKDPEALQAIHDFLRFQIKDHKTGDPLELKSYEPDPR